MTYPSSPAHHPLHRCRTTLRASTLSKPGGRRNSNLTAPSCCDAYGSASRVFDLRAVARFRRRHTNRQLCWSAARDPDQSPSPVQRPMSYCFLRVFRLALSCGPSKAPPLDLGSAVALLAFARAARFDAREAGHGGVSLGWASLPRSGCLTAFGPSAWSRSARNCCPRALPLVLPLTQPI